MHPQPEAQTPADFPRHTELGAVAGVQPKLAVREIDGKVVAGLTVEKFYSRYAVGNGMTKQLADICQSELDERHWMMSSTLRSYGLAICKMNTAYRPPSSRES